MSLINDMLKDLDRRNHQTPGAHVAALRGLGLAGMSMHVPLARRTFTLAGTGLLVAVVLAGIVLNNTMRLRHLQHVQASGNSHAETAIGQAAHTQDAAAAKADAADTVAPVDTTDAAVEVTAATDSGSVSDQHHALTASAVAAQPALPADAPPGKGTAHIEVISRPLTAEQQMARDFRTAAMAVSDGNQVEAEHLLEDLLNRDNGQHGARLLLAGLYVQQQRNSRAESVLASGLLHYPQHAPYAKLYAQLLAAQARDSEAINALQTALPAAGDDADYHALLAGLYQRSGKPAAAAGSYRTALQLAPAHGEWWMGLGISSEQAGDANTAATAYRQALHYPLTTALQQYVQQRLEQLAH